MVLYFCYTDLTCSLNSAITIVLLKSVGVFKKLLSSKLYHWSASRSSRKPIVFGIAKALVWYFMRAHLVPTGSMTKTRKDLDKDP